MKAKAIIALTAIGDPKIKPKVYDGIKGAEIMIELYNIDLGELLNLCEKELNITIEEAK